MCNWIILVGLCRTCGWQQGSKSAVHAWNLFCYNWIEVFGPPEAVRVDQGFGKEGITMQSEFVLGCRKLDIKVINRIVDRPALLGMAIQNIEFTWKTSNLLQLARSISYTWNPGFKTVTSLSPTEVLLGQNLRPLVDQAPKLVIDPYESEGGN